MAERIQIHGRAMTLNEPRRPVNTSLEVQDGACVWNQRALPASTRVSGLDEELD